MTDTLNKYLSDDGTTRIQAVRLDASWRAGLTHQDHPPEVLRLMGELAAAAVLLAGNLKFDGSIVLQLQGNGAVRLVVVECSSDFGLRATAHLQEDVPLPAGGGLRTLLNADGGGRFMVMLDPSSRTREFAPYQGIVPLTGDSVSAALEHYMRQSEQLDTRLWLAADADRCAGLLLQRLPQAHQPAAGDEEDAWARLGMLAATLQPGELLSLESDALIHRLFWQEGLRAFEPSPVRWHCPCSRKRVAGMLRTLGPHEVDSILAEQGRIRIACNFCGRPYVFEPDDCAALFVDGGFHDDPAHPRTLH